MRLASVDDPMKILGFIVFAAVPRSDDGLPGRDH
jgi:hypothetical protein